MTYRDRIKQLFEESQSVLKEYTILYLKAHSGHEINAGLLKECDEKFQEYNKLLSAHHNLLKMVTSHRIKLDHAVAE